jgi:hypothetical protein
MTRTARWLLPSGDSLLNIAGWLSFRAGMSTEGFAPRVCPRSILAWQVLA